MKKALPILLLILGLTFTAQAQAPCPTGQTCSGSVTFTVTFGAPTTPASVSPSSVAQGAPQTTITLNAASGSTFNNTMTVQWCQITPTPCTTATALTTTFVPASQLTAVIPAAQLANSGTFAVYLSQPGGGHAQVTMPAEILATTDKPICTTCSAMKGEVLTTIDRGGARKG